MLATLDIQENILLQNYTTFGIGGPARYFAEVHSQQDVQTALQFAAQQSISFRMIGKGSNALFDDRGYAGLILLNKMQGITWEGNSVRVESGYSFALLGVQTAKKGLSGLEFAAGIPGSVGGSVFMNAGANGQEVSQVITEVGFVDSQGKYTAYCSQDLAFAYRSSSFQKRKGCIISANFTLQPADKVRQKQLDIIAYRTRTQPYGCKSAGCVFRNPPGKSAGALIENAGLKGCRIGGASVSLLHGNFIVNDAKASAEDVLQLAKLVQQKVLECTGQHLEMEVVVVPYEEVGDDGRL